MWEIIEALFSFIEIYNGINDKNKLEDYVKNEFNLKKERTVFTCEYFSIRFSRSKNKNFGNTILSLSKLKKYDNKLFIVCIVTPYKNILLLCNSTFLKKISHSSQKLSKNIIRGSFNGTDILKVYESFTNEPKHFRNLFQIHQKTGFENNLERLVNETSNINPIGRNFNITNQLLEIIKKSPERAVSFIKSDEYLILKNELDRKVKDNSIFIHLASVIPNVNVRGRLIEYLISGKDAKILENLKNALVNEKTSLPEFKTNDGLGDYKRKFDNYYTETDIKTKLMYLKSNPKAYNIDKLLCFLSIPKSVFLFYFIDIQINKSLDTYLISIFDERIIKNTIIQSHWAGRNTRGVTQLKGKVINDIIKSPENILNIDNSKIFIDKLIKGHE